MSDAGRAAAEEAARSIEEAFRHFEREFQALTRMAARHFESRDWHAGQKDGLRRLDLYTQAISELVDRLRHRLKARLDSRALWKRIKGRYARLVSHRADYEIAETFFNSVTRRVFSTVGVDPRIEFIVPHAAPRPASRTWVRSVPFTETRQLIRDILEGYPFEIGFEDFEEDCTLVADRLEGLSIDRVEMIDCVFYRNKGAYLVGRIHSGDRIVPLVFALVNPRGKVVVDAVLTRESEVSMVFSFTRTYFNVRVECPSEMVAFLKSILPLKPVAELYISLGYNKHGKTELFRDFIGHLKRSDDLFATARGERGMVMSVFTLPSYDVVFKIIRDRFAYPKTTNRRLVMEKYRLVFKHDRVGRLIDAQEFEHVTLYRERFSPTLLDELLRVACRTVEMENGRVVLHHLYTERRITPLDLYVREEPEPRAMEAILDYGRAIKQLATANIFPGDMFLKNFGVTRHGRVVFYDYDELCFVTDCHFCTLPAGSGELEDEPISYVGPHDVFPEEFRRFLGLRGRLRERFEEVHGDLFTVKYWQDRQQEILAGELQDFYPYPEERRLREVRLA